MSRKKIALVSSIPYTLFAFYHDLIQTLVSEDWEVHLCSSPGEMLENFQVHFNCAVHRIPILRVISPWTDLLAIWSLARVMRQQQIRIVHAHTPKAGLLTMVASFIARVPNRLYTCHGLPAETETGFKKKLLLGCERLTCLLAHRVLVVSHSLREKLVEGRICKPSKMQILGDGTACGVNLQRFTRTTNRKSESVGLRNQLKLDEDKLVIGFVGRLVPDKGIHILVEAFTDLLEQTPDIRLLVIGDYEAHRGALSEQTVHVIKQNPAIVHIPFTDQIEKYYAVMDILVLPTRREGFPYTLLEAAAMEIPVVATRVTGCVDAVVHQTTGLLIEADSVGQLKDALSELIANQPLRIKMAKVSRERVEKKYASERYTQLHLELYSKM